MYLFEYTYKVQRSECNIQQEHMWFREAIIFLIHVSKTWRGCSSAPARLHM